MIEAPRRNLPRDVFLHLFAMIALYLAAVSFITLCWQYVNYFFPDPLSLRYSYQSYLWPIRFSVASLIIIFPLFILASWYLNKVYRREAQVRESKLRKWLIYLTLFVASLIIIGDLVSVIYNFLGGDITPRFILKALSVLIVAGFVFGYYVDDVRRNEPSRLAKYFAWASGAIILTMVIGAFFIVGSPKSARLSQLDQQKINDLQNIQSQVVNYWQKKGQLPETLADLQDPIAGYVAPNDPQTNQPYEYHVKSATERKFELCAAFNLASGKTANMNGRSIDYSPPAVYPYDYVNQNWEHEPGRACFNRTIDPQLYPPPAEKGKAK